MRTLVKKSAVLIGAWLVAVPAAGQMRGFDELPAPSVYGGIQGTYASTVGEFRDHVRHGAGLNLNLVWTPRPAGPLGLRGDGGFLIYGSEKQRVCFSSTVGCRVQLDMTTTNSIAYMNVGPQLMVPFGPVRPYVNGGVGFAYFSTTSQLEGSRDDSPFASTTNHDDITLAWLGGGGVLIPLSTGRTPVALDLAVRYNGNGRVEYLKKGDIQDMPDGSIGFTPTRSETNLVTFQIGLSFGMRREQSLR
jgi:opacity protein-like surface antigen